MARAPQKKAVAGAARNYVTRTQALKKLQCTLADFRRLCILKGIYPREPRHRKKANKGSTQPAAFYYSKDIQYLLHEPVLHKLREHKAFAKKLSRAIGRHDYSLAQSLADDRPVYRLDHIIKERYPTFADALRDLDDALSLVVLFANMPANPAVPSKVVATCARLATEWQYYVMRTRSLRKVFLSIKGIYFQAEVKGQTVTWLVPYQFTPHVPSEVDFRVMLTFLELYQTLLGFVFFRLFTELNLVYPTTIASDDVVGLGALLLSETSRTLTIEGEKEAAAYRPQARKPTAKDVKRQIRQLAEQAPSADAAAAAALDAARADDALAVVPADAAAEVPALFAPFHFYLSREVTRPTLEFVIRSFGAATVSWDLALGEGSPLAVDDARITHMIVDRPHVEPASSYPGARVLVQPQWVVDCANAGRLLPTELYAPGATLPPHLSPFVAGGVDAYIPLEAGGDALEPASESEAEASAASDVEVILDDDEEFAGFGDAASDDDMAEPASALDAALAAPHDADLVHAAELEAEQRGVAHADFQASIAAARKAMRPSKAAAPTAPADATPPASLLLTGKKRKLYEQLKRRKAAGDAERDALVRKKRALLRKA